VETSLSFFLSNNFERVLELGQDPVRQVRTGIGMIAPDFFDGDEQLYRQTHCGVYPDDEHATDCIDNDRAFSALNGFAPVKSRFYTRIPGFP